MIALTIDNSLSRIEGLSAEQFKQLKEVLSCPVDPKQAYFAGGHRPSRKYLMDKRGTFPTGLLYLVLGYLKKDHLNFTKTDRRITPRQPSKSLFTLSLPFPPYPEQKRAAEALRASHRGIVVAPTGVGKSAIVALAIEALQVPTLVVVPTLELKRQLTEFLATSFGKKLVGDFESGRPIAVDNIAALDPKVPATGYDCVIIDEFHHSGAASYRKLNQKAWTGIYYRLGLTATPFRSQDHERLLLESVLSNVIYEVDYTGAVESGYIVPMEAYYVDVPRTNNVEGYTWAEVYKELVVHNGARNEVIAEMLNHLKDHGSSALCLVKEIAHGDALSALTGIPFANGLDERTPELIAEFNKGGSCLIGTTGVLGEGVDTRPAEYIIVAGLGKSKNALMQSFGRGFRRFEGKSSCKIILFNDRSHKWTKAHYREQVKILKEEYGVTPIKID